MFNKHGTVKPLNPKGRPKTLLEKITVLKETVEEFQKGCYNESTSITELPAKIAITRIFNINIGSS